MDRTLVLASLIISAHGCTRDGGTARIELLLPASLPAETLEVRLRVEEREDERAPGPIIASSVPFLLLPEQSEVKVPALSIPHGDRRVAVVELALPEAERVLYYGVSQSFSLDPGEEVIVPVLIGFVAPPDGTLAIQGERAGFVRSSQVELLLSLDTAERVEISNVIAFAEQASQTFETEPLLPLTVEWNLDRGLDPPCGLSDYCFRQVFVRFIDAFGYAAPTRTSTVVVDSRAPSIRQTPPPSITFEPSWDVRRILTRAAAGTRVRITFALSEPTYAPPLVIATGPQSLELGCEGTTLIYCTLDVDEAAPPPEGTYVVEVTAEDPAGNRSTSTIGSFAIDTTLPRAPDPARTIYRRAPWEVSFAVSGAALAIESGATVHVLDRPDYDAAGTQVVGHTDTASPDGSFGPIELTRADRSRVYAVSVDEAGNRSAAQLVEQIDWIATPGSDMPRSDRNPHVVERVPSFDRTVLEQDPQTILAPTSTEAAWIDREDGLYFAATGAVVWSERNRFGEPAPLRRTHAAAFDRERGRLVVFGGLDGQRVAADTREWDGARWLQPVLATAEPEPRFDAAMVYHAAIGQTLMFGGVGATFFGDTWTFDGAAWDQLLGDAPSPRSKPAMAYDSRRGVTVLFGGNNPGDLLPFGDTWEFDGERWTEALVPSPPPRRDSAMAFDARRGRMVLFGGHPGGILQTFGLRDTWEYDGVSWASIPAGGSPLPPGRAYHAMVYDEARGSVILFGGSESFTTAFDDAWEWVEENGQMRWSPIAGSVPPARSEHTMVYAPPLTAVLVAGGRAVSPDPLSDLWRFDEVGAEEVSSLALAPPPRVDAAAAYDPDTKRLLMFGGTAPGDVFLGDTWIWNGWRWQERLTASQPYLAWPSLETFDGALHLVGSDPDTNVVQLWRWDGADWNLQTSATGIEPTPRILTTIGFDATSNELLLYGGLSADIDGNLLLPLDTYGWNGTEWHEIPSAFPPRGRFGQGMASDADRGTVVMAGGQDLDGLFLDEIWEWDAAGARWMGRLAPTFAAGPPPRADHSMTYDRARSRVVLSGGVADVVFSDLWEWSGAADQWLQIEVAGDAPAPRFGHNVVYDPERQKLLMFGGSHGLADTWELSRDADLRPAVYVGFSTASAPIDRGAVSSLRAIVVAGGRGYDTAAGGIGTAEDGALLLAWDAYAGAWIELAATDAAPESPGEISFSTTSAEDARRLIAADGFVHLMVVPASGAGNGPAAPAITVDVAELRVSYRVN